MKANLAKILQENCKFTDNGQQNISLDFAKKILSLASEENTNENPAHLVSSQPGCSEDKAKVLHISYQQNNGNVDFVRLLEEILKCVDGPLSEEELKRTFETIDSDRDGVISCDQMWESLKKFGMVSRDEVVDMIEKLGKGCAGAITLTDFVQVIGAQGMLSAPSIDGLDDEVEYQDEDWIHEGDNSD
ncbi:uncharacterized protein LOC134854707 [Symsagittifera roscoffensis]|uniref:uncharacterized protein LOC134854707 n=1 Tax=Symsagittifera roscoffensis TaxID=84072 RepID=UPI00307B66B8